MTHTRFLMLRYRSAFQIFRISTSLFRSRFGDTPCAIRQQNRIALDMPSQAGDHPDVHQSRSTAIATPSSTSCATRGS